MRHRWLPIVCQRNI